MRMSSRTMWGLMALAVGAGLVALLAPSARRQRGSWRPAIERDNAVDQASEESFPASDPPSFSGTTANTP